MHYKHKNHSKVRKIQSLRRNQIIKKIHIPNAIDNIKFENIFISNRAIEKIKIKH